MPELPMVGDEFAGFRLRAGRVREDVWNWWYAVHHNIGFGGTSPMNM